MGLPTPYAITLTADECYTITFIGNRYCWSEWARQYLCEGENKLTEPDAWTFAMAIEADMEGNHSPFPMLNERSELYDKLMRFWQSIV